MKKILKYLLLPMLIVLARTNELKAQMELQGSQYIFDKTFINPAFSGTEGLAKANIQFRLNGREQNLGKSYTLSAAGNVLLQKVKSSIGVNVVKSTFGNDSYTLGYINYVYHLPVSETTVLSSGISLGIQQFDINLLNLVTVQQNDPLAKTNVYSSKFDARFGLQATVDKKYYVGLSFDNILSLYTKKDDFYNQVPPTFRRINMYLIAGAKIDYDTGMQLKPSVLFMKNFGGITSVDINASFIFNGSVGFGIGFRQQIEEAQSVALGNDGQNLKQSLIRPMIQYDINSSKRNLKIGYCYGFNASQSVGVSRETHDISLIYNMP